MSLRGSRVGGVPTDEGVFGTGALNENIVGVIVRAAMSGEDASAAAGFRNVPIASRAALAAQAYTDQRLLVDGVVRGDDGVTYSAIPARAGNVAISESIVGLLVDARVVGWDSDAVAGSQNIPVQARNAVAAQSYTVYRLLTDSVLRGDDGATWSAVAARNWDADGDAGSTLIGLIVNARLATVTGASGGATVNRLYADLPSGISGTTDTAVFALWTASYCVGRDTTGAAVARPVEARDYGVDGDADAALIGLLTNARNAVFQTPTSSVWTRISGDAVSSLTGESTGSQVWTRVASSLFGVDTTGAAVVRSVEARNADADGDFATTLIGLLVNSRNALLDASSGGWVIQGGLREVTGGVDAALIYETRESGYVSSIRERRFIATSQTAGATLTAQAAFVATTPTLMLRQAAGATETEVVRSISITSFAATPAGIRVVVMLDPDDRFSAGGTAVVPQNPNEGSAAASGITSFLENPTATAADADERIIYNEGFAGGVGAKLVLEFKDEMILSGVGTILVYVFDSAGAAAPTIAWNFEWEEYV